MAVPEIEGLEGLVEVGRGGFGVVYRASQPSAGREVAVKVLAGVDLDERDRTRFRREALAMGSLAGHPHILQLHEAGLTADGTPYLTMPFMAQWSLAHAMSPNGLPGTAALDVAVKLCGALEAAHHQGIVHRDVKPDNVLFTAYGEPQLADFGIARLANHTTTKTGSITASVAYAAPEVLGGARPSVATDVYSLGATFYSALAGAPAFVEPEDESLLPILMRVTTEPPPDLRAQGVPDPVWQVLAWSMAKQAEERPPSAAAFGRALQMAQQELELPISQMTLPGAAPLNPLGGWEPGVVAGSAPKGLSTVPADPPLLPSPAGREPMAPPPMAVDFDSALSELLAAFQAHDQSRKNGVELADLSASHARLEEARQAMRVAREAYLYGGQRDQTGPV